MKWQKKCIKSQWNGGKQDCPVNWTKEKNKLIKLEVKTKKSQQISRKLENLRINFKNLFSAKLETLKEMDEFSYIWPPKLNQDEISYLRRQVPGAIDSQAHILDYQGIVTKVNC